MRSGPPLGSRRSITQLSPKRSCRTDDDRGPAGAINRKKCAARIRISPSFIYCFSVVVSVVLSCSLRSDSVMGRFWRGASDSLCAFAISMRALSESQSLSMNQKEVVEGGVDENPQRPSPVGLEVGMGMGMLRRQRDKTAKQCKDRPLAKMTDQNMQRRADSHYECRGGLQSCQL